MSIGANNSRIEFAALDESEYTVHTGYTYEFSNGLYIGAEYEHFFEVSGDQVNLDLGWRF